MRRSGSLLRPLAVAANRCSMSFERAVGARRPGKVSEDPPAAPGFNVPVPASPRLRTMTGEGARRILHTSRLHAEFPNRLTPSRLAHAAFVVPNVWRLFFVPRAPVIDLPEILVHPLDPCNRRQQLAKHPSVRKRVRGRRGGAVRLGRQPSV